jgi:hypothetical protein
MSDTFGGKLPSVFCGSRTLVADEVLRYERSYRNRNPILDWSVWFARRYGTFCKTEAVALICNKSSVEASRLGRYIVMDRLEELKNKYRSVLDLIKQKGVRLTHVHVQDNKLFIQGAAPSEQIKNDIWNQIKSVDSSYSDLTCDLSVDTSLAQPAAQTAAASAGAGAGNRTYKVQAGDTLSKIAKEFYGDPNKYQRIFEANRDKLENPDKIRPGQELVIPS